MTIADPKVWKLEADLLASIQIQARQDAADAFAGHLVHNPHGPDTNQGEWWQANFDERLNELRIGRVQHPENAFHKATPRGVDTGVIAVPSIATKKPVDQLDLEGNFIRSWPSGIEAARTLASQGGGRAKAFSGGISSCARGVRVSAFGFKWRYAEVRQ